MKQRWFYYRLRDAHGEYHTYSLDPAEVRKTHAKFCRFSDARFRRNARGALHLATLLAFIRNESADSVLCDTGPIHELVHLVTIKGHAARWGLRDIRRRFEALRPSERVLRAFKRRVGGRWDLPESWVPKRKAS